VTGADTERTELAELVRELGVVHGRVTLASGAEADYYVDLRRVTLHHRAAPLVGRLMRVLTADWNYAAVGGLTLGADPVADAVLHAVAAERANGHPEAPPVDAFVVRKSTKEHGLQRLIEGPDVAGRRVLVVEDTSTTGGSVLTAVRAVREAGATVVGVATVVDRGTGAREAIEAEGAPYRSLLGLADLGLA
jgi:orotate phosphoribosyltransferase